MEKRFRQFGKSLSPSGYGFGSKAPPSKRTCSQTNRKTSSAVSGLTTSQQTEAIQSGSMPLENFHGVLGTGSSPTKKLDIVNLGQLEYNLKPTDIDNTRASFSKERANSDSVLLTSGNFEKTI